MKNWRLGMAICLSAAIQWYMGYKAGAEIGEQRGLTAARIERMEAKHKLDQAQIEIVKLQSKVKED